MTEFKNMAPPPPATAVMIDSKRAGMTDGLVNVLSNLPNRRNAAVSNVFDHRRLTDQECRAVFKSGMGSKICKIKAGYALNDTLQFEDDADKQYYETTLAADVLKAARFMVGFGRGIVVLYRAGDNLAMPFNVSDDDRPIKQRVFSGDMVSVSEYGMDFEEERYYKPKRYQVRGHEIHWSRVVDFVYVEPPEEDAPQYKFGGISEFEMIYPQLINDGVVERASGAILEKNATIFYGVEGFRDLLAMGKDKDLIRYFSALEDRRSIYGAGLVDKNDTVTSIAQALTNLADVDNIALRRLAMVTGIPLAWLIGENVKGLNSTGDNERQIFQDMIETFQYEYLLVAINRMMKLHGRKPVTFKENQGETPLVRIDYETKAITNAKALWDMGEDHAEYLDRHGVTQKDDMTAFFSKDGDDNDELTPEDLQNETQPDGVTADPNQST